MVSLEDDITSNEVTLTLLESTYLQLKRKSHHSDRMLLFELGLYTQMKNASTNKQIKRIYMDL